MADTLGKTIQDYKDAYNAARAKGDTAGMKAANDGANAIRSSNGMSTQSASQDISDTLGKTIQDYKDAYNAARAKGDTAGMKAANDGANAIRSSNGMNTQSASQDISNMQASNSGAWIGGGNSPYGKIVGGSADSASYPEYQGATAAKPNDYSSYVSDLYSAKTDSALAALKSAYDSNILDLNASEQKITPTYQAARNKTASASDLEKQNFQEYAAARGLNSGTGGQAELARSTTLQGNLNDINTQEADARSGVELQRTKLTNEYNTAIAKAKADGNYELANALYTEKVRVDTALSDAADKQATYDYNTWNANYGLFSDRQNRLDTLAATKEQYAREDASANRETAYNTAMATIQSGNMPPDSVIQAAGIDKTSAQYLAAYYKGQVDMINEQNRLAIAQAKKNLYSSGSSGGSGGSSSKRSSKSSGKSSSKSAGSGGGSYDKLYAAAFASGHPKSFIANNYKQYGFSSSTGLYDDYSSWADANTYDAGSVSNVAKGLLTDLEKYYGSREQITNKISQEQASGGISDNDAKWLLSKFGLF